MRRAAGGVRPPATAAAARGHAAHHDDDPLSHSAGSPPKKKVVKKAAPGAAAAAGGAKRTGLAPAGPAGAKRGVGGKAKKPEDPLAEAKREAAGLRKELAQEREAAEQRISSITREANERIGQYEEAVKQLEAELAAAHNTIAEVRADRDHRIATLERERDARYQQYENFLAVGEKMRAELHNALIELKGNIRVFARVRPILPKELSNRANPSSKDHYVFPEGTDHRGLHVVDIPGHTSVMGKEEKSKQMQFLFDKVFDQRSTQEGVFSEISQLVQSALDGYKVCIFAYGQTGSGKTFTMEGPEPGKDTPLSGMIPRAVRQIFDNCQWKSEQTGFKYRLFCSFVQIYNDTIHDLMRPQDCYQTGPGRDALKHEIRNTETESIVTNITEEEVTDERTVFRLLQKASDNRKTSGTRMNEVSSRSHSIFIMKIKGWNEATQQEMSGQLNLIDLAGSERLAKSGSEGDRLRETQHINKSLACLSDVIVALGKGAASVPFRQSKLTHILQPSMTNQSKVLMFVNINPIAEHLNESICSLRFAAKVNACEIGIAKRKVGTK